MSVRSSLAKAWESRQRVVGPLEKVLRVFHGPGEGPPGSFWNRCSVDRFDQHYWVTLPSDQPFSRASWEELVSFYQDKGAQSVVCFARARRKQEETEKPHLSWGHFPEEGFWVTEGQRSFWIRFTQRHPGLFLDHCPLRNHLQSGWLQGKSVLNAFAYTGSLSVATALGGAAAVTTLDLSSSVLAWAEKNFQKNSLSPAQSERVVGDCLDWFRRWKKQGRQFDVVILDPPSFSRSSNGVFSVEKQLYALHAAALDCLASSGWLVTSVNTVSFSREAYAKVLCQVFQERKRTATVVHEIDLPPSFPTSFFQPSQRYLKGWVLHLSASDRTR